jgi:hypothetical protein
VAELALRARGEVVVVPPEQMPDGDRRRRHLPLLSACD